MIKIFKIKKQNFKGIIKIAAESINEGKVLICPTDTVYGLICDATNKKAVLNLFKIKKRPKTKPIPIFVKNIKAAKTFAFINKNQEKILRKIWPGKMTAVLKSKVKTQKSKVYGINKETIALRIPNYRLVNNLLKKLNRPLAGTSANISGKPASTEIREVLKQFKNHKYQPDLVISAGDLPKSKPSTVLDLTTYPPKILRP